MDKQCAFKIDAYSLSFIVKTTRCLKYDLTFLQFHLNKMNAKHCQLFNLLIHFLVSDWIKLTFDILYVTLTV